MKYLDIYVMISPAPDGDYAVKAMSTDGGTGNSKLKLPFRLGELSPSIFGASSASRGTSFGDPDTGRVLSIETIGTELFEALFNRGTLEVLTCAENVARLSPEKTGVRIRLSMNLAAEGMAEVASLPWELMRRRDQDPLVVSVSTPLVRAFDVASPVYFHPIVGKLKILLLVSNPKGTNPLNLSDEKARICKVWDGLENVEYVECRPEAQTILDLLSKNDFHVVHYMGHGNFDKGVGQLIMEDAQGNEQPVSGSVFANWLHDQTSLRLVFLNACNTGTNGEQNELHPFAGVASALIGGEKPAVVAMQFPISDDAAIIFAETFYRRIAQGFSVEQAVSEGRKSLIDRVGSEWATPVLYMRAADGDLFDRPGGRASPAPDNPPAASTPAEPEPVSANQPQGLMSAIPEPTPTPWFKKPVVMAALGAVLGTAALVVSLGTGTPPVPEPLVSATTEAEATGAAEATGNPIETALAAIPAEDWINDPECKIAYRVLATKGVDTQAVVDLAKERFNATDNPKLSRQLNYVVGCLYIYGMDGYPATPGLAVGWLEGAASPEIPQAKYFLGEIYETGAPKSGDSPEVPVNLANARTNYRDSAEGGNEGAKKKLDELDQAEAAAETQQ